MQREKFYNLESTAYFNSALFCFQKKQNSMRSIFAVAQSGRLEICFF
jgi:hypothetical protein